jgi:DNA-binding NtrC family response regulator
MKILIVENEIYLAQSICTKLTENGYVCDIVTNMKDALRNEKYDAVLLSTNISGQNFYPIIEKHKNSIIILMISYISSDTILNPIKAGASDYIQKPFMIEELLRKLQHLKLHGKLLDENRTFRSYIDNQFASVKIAKSITKRITQPLLLKSSSQNSADAIAFNYAREFDENFTFISLTQAGAFDKVAKSSPTQLLYLVNFQDIKTIDKQKLYPTLEHKRAMISTTDMSESEWPYDVMDAGGDEGFFEKLNVLTIDDYIKSVLVHFQDKLPDTELAKRLGISRKGLWERRRRYGIQKR